MNRMKQNTRKAVKRPTEIVAECPYGDGVCTCKISGSKQWLHCGNYDGTIKNTRGLFVVCLAGSERRNNAE